MNNEYDADSVRWSMICASLVSSDIHDVKFIKIYSEISSEIYAAGGNPYILPRMSFRDFLLTCVKNNIDIKVKYNGQW